MITRRFIRDDLKSLAADFANNDVSASMKLSGAVVPAVSPGVSPVNSGGKEG